MGKFLNFSYEDFTYKLYVPSGFIKEEEIDLLVMLHGCEQTPDDFAAGTRMNQIAEKEGFLVLYPDIDKLFDLTDPENYNPLGCWNWFLDENQHRGQGQPKFIFEIVKQVERSYKVNRVFAVGFSAGAAMAGILGAAYPDVFSGIAICSGLVYNAADVFFLTDPTAQKAIDIMHNGVQDPYACGKNAFHEMGKFKRKMPVIVFHGISDTTVHPINGQQVIIQWAQTNFLAGGGKGMADVIPDQLEAGLENGRSFTRHQYSNFSLELWLIDRMGHTWPGGSPEGSYTDPLGPNASELIWGFFKKIAKNTSL